MKKCPGCNYLWADDYNGTCMECGKPLGGVSASPDLSFKYAAQIAAGRRENDSERAMARSSGKARPGDAYDRVGKDVPQPILDRAREMLVQREEVVYEQEEQQPT